MDTGMDKEPKLVGTELYLKGLIYVRALRLAGGASTEELQRFSAEIRRQQRQLEGERGQIRDRARIRQSIEGAALAL
jgi:hypothetical protein